LTLATRRGTLTRPITRGIAMCVDDRPPARRRARRAPERGAACAMLAACATLAACAVLAPSLGAQPAREAGRPADLVLTGGRVFTADSTRPWAEAVAVRGARVLAVGSDAEVLRHAGPRTRRIALGGRVVVPGFNDAHDHVGVSEPAGAVRFTADPAPTPDPPLAAVRDSLAALVRRVPAGRWLVTAVGGRVFDDAAATRAALDAVAPAHPVWITGWSGHGALLNSAALRAAGLLDARDPLGGWQTRDGDGRPAGRVDEYVLYGAARRLATAEGPAATLAAARAHGAESVRLGITTVQDMATGYTPAVARALAASGAMRVRHRVLRFPMTDGAGRAGEWTLAGRDTVLGPTTHVAGVKWVLDGTPVERLALMREPYADRAGWHGRANFPADTLRVLLREALARGWQPMLHAVGDSTIALLFAAMRDVAPDSVWRRVRPRLEHGDGLARDQFDVARRLGVVVVQNPSHLAIPEVLAARWGAERMARLDHLRALVEAGIPLALGSDGPRSPGLNLMLATLHPSRPGEALTREQAVVAYTRGSAWAEHAEREKGTLAPGMLADLAVLSQDVFTVPPPALPATTSVLTLVGGRVVHDALGARPRRSGVE
jgi:predicted amidohydrolase YtcJ